MHRYSFGDKFHFNKCTHSIAFKIKTVYLHVTKQISNICYNFILSYLNLFCFILFPFFSSTNTQRSVGRRVLRDFVYVLQLEYCLH